jgi:hypothetical protein
MKAIGTSRAVAFDSGKREEIASLRFAGTLVMQGARANYMLFGELVR